MSDILSSLNSFEILFQDCLFERRYIDQASDEELGATWNGDAAITSVSGQRFKRALALDGTGDYVSYGNLTCVDVGTGDFSVEFTINTADTAGVICGKRDGANNGWIVETAAGPDINFQIDDGTEASGNNTTALSSGWHHVIISADRSGNATFYIDGSADGTLDISGSSGTLTNATDFQVGIDGDDSSNPLNGNIGMIRFWRDKVISATEAEQLAAAEGFGSGSSVFDLKTGLVSYWPLGNLVDPDNIPDIVGTNTADPTGITKTGNTVAGYTHYRNALNFNGTNEYVDCGDADDLSFGNGTTDTPFSLSFWQKKDNNTNSGAAIAKSTTATNGEYQVYTSPNGSMYFRVIDASTGGRLGYSKNGLYIPNIWEHFIMTYDGSASVTGIKVYKNGERVTPLTDESSGSYTAMENTNTHLYVGFRGTYFDGKIQDVMIYNKAITQLQAELVYKRQLMGLKI